MLKTIPKREFDQLRSILREYLEHLVQNPDSIITKFFGMYQIQWDDTSKQTLRCGETGAVGPKHMTAYLVIMDNLFKNFDVGLRFDLKGSSIGRTRLRAGESLTSNRDITVAVKDNDFRVHMH
jgi:1-phosphatidylinositol-4-phosphate 5-kinase